MVYLLAKRLVRPFKHIYTHRHIPYIMKSTFTFYITPLLLACLQLCTYWLCTAQNINNETTSTASELRKTLQYNHEFDVYFKQAYQQYPSLPPGILEATAFTNTRIYHLVPEEMMLSCLGMPQYHGVMGLVENGKGYFRNNLLSISQLSSITISQIKEHPLQNIMAYAAAFAHIQEELNISNPNSIANNVAVIFALSELPYNEATATNDFALNSHLYSVLYHLNDSSFREHYNITAPLVDISNLMGANTYNMVSSSQIDLSINDNSNNPQINYSSDTVNIDTLEQANGMEQQACSMPNGPVEYTTATWTAPDASNYSTYNISPYTVAIHTLQGTYAGAISWFQNPIANVSVHYVIRSFDGQVTQMVCHRNRAWHVNTENSYAVGIEHDGYVEHGYTWYTDTLYRSSAELVQFIAEDLGSLNLLQTYDGPPENGLNPLSHSCHKVKGHQHFTNNTHVDPGNKWNWYRYYRLVNELPPAAVYLADSGTIFDSGGNTGNYNDNERSTWLIQPNGGASELVLNFTYWEVEANWDYLWIYDGTDDTGALLGVYSETSPDLITAYTGAVFMEFRSDCATTGGGWAIDYTAYNNTLACNVPQNLEATPNAFGAVFSWLAVPEAIQFELSIKTDLSNTWTSYLSSSNSFELSGLSPGEVYEWRVRSDCGTSFSAYNGSAFVTPDIGNTITGPASYTSNLCSGTFYDSGGLSDNYHHREDWTYTIAPSNATEISVTFAAFDVELNYDYLYVYDGSNTLAPLIGSYTGNSVPDPIVSTGGALTFRFASDYATYKSGWEASWTCVSDSTLTCQPNSSITPLNDWYSTNFTANFTDIDNCNVGLDKSFYQVQTYQSASSEWRTNTNVGFLHDSFNNSNINTEWTAASGTWSINNNSAYQSDETNNNTKLYINLNQNNNQVYLYHWQANMNGDGSNKRSGIHFFGDNASASNLGNSYFVYFRVDQDKAQIYKVDANTWTLQTNNDVNIEAGVWYDYKVIFNPTTGLINAYVNDVLVSSWIDPNPHTSGNHLSLRSGGCTVNYDFIDVYQARTDNQNISVGAANTNMINVESTNPTTAAARISTYIIDNNKHWSDISYQTCKIDFSPPSDVLVFDGIGADIDITNDGTQITANWTASTDSNSDIANYFYAIGTNVGSNNVLDWTNNGSNTNFTENLTLIDGLTYHVSIKAENGVGLQSNIVSSDGQTADLSVCIITSNISTISNWQTTNFDVDYTDTDCGEDIQYAFEQVMDFDGMEWRCNANYGMFNDDFNLDNINASWIVLDGNWNEADDYITQNDESDSNTNIYAPLLQENSHDYLFHWRSRMTGSGTNRRSGIHFFCSGNAETSQRTNSYLVYFRVDQNKCQIYQATNNDIGSPLTNDDVNVNANEWYDYKVTYSPNTGLIKAYANNILVSEWTSPTPHLIGEYISFRTGNCVADYDFIRIYRSRNNNSSLSLCNSNANIRYESIESNAAGLVRNILVSDLDNWSNIDEEYFLIDCSAATSVLVNDGIIGDTDTTYNNNTLSANWTISSDPNSDIAAYWLAVGTSPGASDVLNFTNIGLSTSYTATDLNLVEGITYYTSIQVENGAGLLNELSPSDGISYFAPCEIVNNINVSNIGFNQATVNWETSGSNTDTYQILYKPQASTLWDTLSTNNISINLSNLSPCTNYELQLISNCTFLTSVPSPVQIFTTASYNADWLGTSIQACVSSLDLTNLIQGDLGGTFSGGTYISSSGIFTTAGLTPGTYSVSYTVGSAGCVVSETNNITLMPALDASWTSTNLSNCDTPIDLNMQITGNMGGSWSGGTHISISGIFTPTNLAVGNYAVTYSLNEGVCSDSVNNNISVVACTSGVQLKAKVMLQAAFDGINAMQTHLLNSSLLPLQQPYNTAPWNYNGNEALLNANNFPSNVVDWVLVELRAPDNIDNVVAQQAAFLLSNGTVANLSGSEGIYFDISAGNYYVIIRHRNHLDVVSNEAISLPNTLSIDFTQADNVMGSNSQLIDALGDGSLFTLINTDLNGDGVISVYDFNYYLEELSTINTYVSSDCTFDGHVTVSDFNAYLQHTSNIGVWIVRY